MGIVRVYLALCVVAAHSRLVFPWAMHDGRQAVQIFYIISGFYMALVLSSRYPQMRDFYLSRFLRVFPSYWIVCIGTLLVCAVGGWWFHDWLLLKPFVSQPLDHYGAAGLVLAAVSNLTLFGQDWVLFLSHDKGQALRFTADFQQDASPLWKYLLVPQCWSVGLEICYYALAPFLNRLRSRWLVMLVLVAAAARLAAYSHLGLMKDPWTYRFFPFELGLFLMGMLGYRLYAGTVRHHPASMRLSTTGGYLLAAAVLLLLLFLHTVGTTALCRVAGYEAGVMLTYPLWALAVPILFLTFGGLRQDRLVGELSYPIYLVHYVVIAVVSPVLEGIGGASCARWTGTVSAIISVGLAVIFYVFQIAPMDRCRHVLTFRKLARQGESPGVQLPPANGR